MAIKKMKFERRAARMARQAASPPPEQTMAMAADGVDINRGNSDQVPLSDVGQQEAEQLGERFAAKGGLDKLVVSPAQRTQQTAQAIAAKSPSPIPMRQEPGIESWAQGDLEGQAQSAVNGEIRNLIRKDPRRVLPGQGAMSSKPGESFDQFRLRALPAVRGIMQEYAEGAQQNPNLKIGVPMHSHVIKLTKAWLKKGAPDDFSIDPSEMDKDVGPPGGVEHLYPNQKGEWEFNNVDMKSDKPIPPGILSIRHAVTPQNKETYEKADQQHKALANMVQATQTLKFSNIKQWAQKASEAGMPDSEIESYIDQSLPNAKAAANLSMPQILAIAASASPKKRKEYMPLLASHFGNLNALPPDSRKILADHIAAIQNAR